MKTKMNISNLKKLGLTVLASVALVNGAFSSEGKESASTALVNLEVFMEVQEEALKYSAEAFEAEEAINRVEGFANFTEASLRYSAAEFTEADIKAEEIAPEMNRLEDLAAGMEVSLKYQAPAEDEAVEAVPAMERLEILAESAEASLKYRAPVAAENEIYDVTGSSANDMMAQTK